MKTIITIFLSIIALSAFAQQSIDGTFPFQTDTAKKYSLYIPTSYNAATPNKAMLALHPFNTNRWDADSFRNFLIDFAETNQLILIVPDGGADGKIDDPIDTAFTSVLLDSAANWYNIDAQKLYVMGFSWGGKTTYTYGLRRPQIFGGYMPIGAAVALNEVTPVSTNANGKAFFLVHNDLDDKSNRFTPILNELNAKGAITNSIQHPGWGHTIDYPDFNNHINTAFTWIDSVNCSQIPNASESLYEQLEFKLMGSNRVKGNEILEIEFAELHAIVDVELVDIAGRVVQKNSLNNVKNAQFRIEAKSSGFYLLNVKAGALSNSQKIIIQ